ncbi:MAG: HAD-IIIC family phosphatase [Bacteroidales bacterium]|nr:HAD-IIIC family phosphatase [Bacteroidales bacterium]
MNYFVFRNNTVERFFPKDFTFSGYDDISHVPSEVDGYVWFYQLPVKYEQEKLCSEIRGFAQKFSFVLAQVDAAKPFIVLTMDEGSYAVPFTSGVDLLSAVFDYNASLAQLEENHSNVKLLDIREFTRQYPVSEVFDWKFWFISQMGLNPRLSKPFAEWFARKLDEIALKRKKCLILDLDNTLWGGVLGEDGIEGIKLGGDYPGKAFHYFQEALLELSKNGVILTICSKNNESDVLEVWEKNPFMVLKKDSFAAWRINWQDKATNIRELADELNIGLDSFVFIDDNPTERELIKQALPMVEVPDFPTQPYNLPIFFKELVERYFRVYSITSEDKKKTEQYKANAQRAQAQKSFVDFDTFLKSLDIQITIEEANEFNIPRIAQMTQKTNQFNLTTKRYTETDIHTFLQQGWKIWCISVADKFGDNGITGCIMLKGDAIDTFLMSCRILGKGIEIVFIKNILSLLKENGKRTLKAEYIPTSKNEQVKDFYDKLGFERVSEKDGMNIYKADLSDIDLSVKDYYHIIVK